MGVCRLCLKDVEGTGVPNISETLIILKKLFPHQSRALKSTKVICEICSDNISTAEKFLKKKNETEKKIKAEAKRLNVAKINLRGFHRDVSDNICVCRICLKLIRTPEVFLYESNTNILRQDLIKNMFKYCHLSMNYDISDKPVMCIRCWEDLQIIYSFKKDYSEVERQIKEYCREFKLRNKNIAVDVLQRVKNYFSDEYCEIISCNIKEEVIDLDAYIPPFEIKICTYQTSTPINKSVKEELRFVKNEHSKECSDICIPPKIYKFNKNDNLILIRVYYEVTNNEHNFPCGYWKLISDKWSERMPKRPIPVEKLGFQIQRVFAKGLLSQEELECVKKSVEADNPQKKPPQIQMRQDLQHYSDSDDSFVEEVVHSSFTPCIKSEPLNESDIEFNSTETKLEVVSDCESIPQLERMDLPPLSFKIENIYSLEVKREAYDDFMRLDEDMNTKPDNLNKSRRDSLRLESRIKSLFKCNQCCFETRFSNCAERHILLHQRGKKKIHQCPICPYRITNKWMFNRHMKAHREEENEIPVLQPCAFPIDLNRW